MRPGDPRLLSTPRHVVGAPRLVTGTSRSSQACHQHSPTCCWGSVVLPRAPIVLSGASRCSQTYHNHSHGAPVPVIRDPSYSECQPECPPSGLMFTWNWRIKVYPPHPLSHSCRLPVTKIHFPDVAHNTQPLQSFDWYGHYMKVLVIGSVCTALILLGCDITWSLCHPQCL